MIGLQAFQNGTVSFLKAPLSLPAGNADTITNSLGPYPNKNARDLIFGAASTGFFAYNTPSCGSGSVGGPGLGSQLVGQGLASVPVVGGVLSTIFGAFKGHHAAAVANEQATLCQAVPDANAFLRGIDAALTAGQLDTAAAAQALEQAYQNWRGEVGGILQDTGGHCNAACIYAKAFRAAIEYRKQNYALIAAQHQSTNQGLLYGVTDAFQGIASAVGVGNHGASAASSSSISVLDAAGLTPARQNTLAMSIMVGGLLVVGVLWLKFISGAKKE